jgi:hypothetical protein
VRRSTFNVVGAVDQRLRSIDRSQREMGLTSLAEAPLGHHERAGEINLRIQEALAQIDAGLDPTSLLEVAAAHMIAWISVAADQADASPVAGAEGRAA